MKKLMFLMMVLGLIVFAAGNVPAKFLERVEVKSYELRWNDAGSGTNQDIALWHPKAPNGYFVLGSMGIGDNNANPNGKVLTYAYKPLNASIDFGGKPVPVIVYPNDFQLLWTDKGSGAKKNGSVWKAICPANYLALGFVAMAEHNRKPSKTDIGCILNSSSILVQQGASVKVRWFRSPLSLATYKASWGTDILSEPVALKKGENLSLFAARAKAKSFAVPDIVGSAVR